MLYKLVNQTDAFLVTTDSWTISGWQEATARKASLSLFLSGACPVLQIMHRNSAPCAVPHQKVSGIFLQLHRGITTVPSNEGSVNDPAQLADSPTGIEQPLCVKRVLWCCLVREGHEAHQQQNWTITGNSSIKPAQPILTTVINTKPREPIFHSNTCTKMPGFKSSGPLQIFYSKTPWPNRKEHPDLQSQTDLVGLSLLPKARRHLNTKPVTETPTVLQPGKVFRMISHLWPHPGTETDLLSKMFQSQVSLWHIFEPNCICNFEVRAWRDW